MHIFVYNTQSCVLKSQIYEMGTHFLDWRFWYTKMYIYLVIMLDHKELMRITLLRGTV